MDNVYIGITLGQKRKFTEDLSFLFFSVLGFIESGTKRGNSKIKIFQQNHIPVSKGYKDFLLIRSLS